jgi:tRNA G18 (ribose-2'-O)-methylase SpoU
MAEAAIQAGAIPVERADDPRLTDFRGLREKDLRARRGEDAHGELFIGEQMLVVEKMLKLPGVTKSVLVTPNHLDRVMALAPRDVAVYVAPLAVMSELAGFEIHRGVLAAGWRRMLASRSIDGLVPRPGEAATLLVCEDITNLDNIGLLFRNAAAFGADGVVLSPRCHDPLYRKSLRVSIGHALTVPWARSRDWAGDLARLKREMDLTLIGTSLDRSAADLDSVPRVRRAALLVGQEFSGLSKQALALCDTIVRIPMAAGVDSLNVATAAAVCLHRLSNGPRQ